VRVTGTLMLAAWLVATALAADFRVEGGANNDFLQKAGVVAVLPAICPANVDCAWLDRQVAGEILRRKQPQFLSAAAARAALAALGVQEVSAENRKALAATVGAQTLLEVRVRELEKVRTRWQPDPDEAAPGSMEKSDRGNETDREVRGRLEIRAISAETGKTLAEGAAFGDAPASSEKKLLGPMLTELLARMFPLRTR
jgi:hypothetical protein